MALTRDRCLCLRKVEYSETSQILTLFGRGLGLIRCIAKGAHRRTKAGASKFDGGCDLLDLGEAVFSLRLEKDLATLTEWSLRDGHLELRASLRALYLGQYAAELTSLLFEEHDPHPWLFDRLAHTLTELATPRAEEAFLAFELDLIREAGYLPDFTACANCRASFSDRAGTWSFSPARGGVICRNCEGVAADRVPIDPRLLSLASSLLRLPRANGHQQRLPRLSRAQTDPLNRVFAHHVQHTLGRPLRLPKFVISR
ncbi:MAG TPA: DNA repair protein RecO [Tepidisphaeraceae bacterium]|nr:DNA repair protein RecO [Tepidisphaeraceae bacterium]